MVIGLTLALLIVIPGMALGVFGGFTVIYALIILLTRKRLKNYSQLIARESNNVIKSIQEGLYGIRDVLIDGSQESFCDIYKNTNHVLRYTQGNNQLISQGPRYAVDVLAMVLVATLAYVLSKQAGGMAEAIPVLAALALGMQRLLPFLQQVYGSVSTIHGAQASLQDVLGFLDQTLPDHVEASEIQSIPFRQYIQLRGVSFRYTQQSPWVFNNVNLNIAKGARIGFIGTTGCGKSTLIDIIMGLLQPTEGVLEIDNQPVTMANNRLWQMHIAHVPQSVFLADCSIEENIAFGVPRNKIDSVRVRQAAEQAQIEDVIEALPQKYHTFVGERGVQLSGGQRQRLGIARALYKRADVIIFDEATSALDSETELAVMNAIEALSENITVLIIAHRQNTLRNCTEIVELGKKGISGVAIQDQ
jgi:ATP-binding cassette subfamily B protein